MIDKKNFEKLEELWKTIEDRAHTSSPEESYVSSLLSKGLKECAKKLGEEGVETSLAAFSMNKKETINESADLLFHLLVLWKAAGLKPEEILEELHKRESISGLTEKKNMKYRFKNCIKTMIIIIFFLKSLIMNCRVIKC